MICIDEGESPDLFIFDAVLIAYGCSLLLEPRQPADNVEQKSGTMKSSELFGWASRDKS